MLIRKISLMICIVNSIAFYSYGQQKYVTPCISLKLNANTGGIKLKDLDNYEILYSITNCSSDSLFIDTLDIPNYDEHEGGNINFRIYSRTGECKYPANPKDLQRMIDFEHNHSIYLKNGQTYTYHIKLFKYYDLELDGDYTIYASYQIPLKDDSGYYLKPAENYLYLTIE